MHFRTALITLLCCVLAVAAFGQAGNVTTGGINGQVTESSGAGLPGVTVTGTNVDTGLTRNVVTENDGTYTVNLLPPGRYRVDAELAGLGKSTVSNVVVLLGNSTKADLTLAPTVAETITVTAAAPVIDTARTGTAVTVTEQQIENLPILGRDWRSLAQLTPGIVDTFGGRISSNGARGISTDYNIDGASSNNDFFGEQTGGTRAPFTFSQAAIKEFQVVRSQYNAEYGRGIGAQINAITKSGTNDINGEAFYFLRKRSWAATRPRTLSNGQVVTESFRARDSAQPGFAVGGPIVRDKLFYFANYDGQQQKLPSSPTDVIINPMFTALPAATQAAFLSKIEALIGRPYTQELSYNQTFNQSTYLLKLDANVGSKNHFSLRDNYTNFENGNNQGFNLLSNQGTEHDKFNQLVGQGETVVTNNLFNQFIVQYSKDERPIVPNSTSPEVVVTYAPQRTAFLGQNDFLPNNTVEKKTQLKDTVHYVRGSHTLKGGGEAILMKIDNLFPRNLNGVFRYNSVANYIDNVINQFQQGYGAGGGLTSWNQNTYGFFVSDNLRLGSRWNFDVGVRYDWQTMPTPEANAFPQHPEFITQIREDKNNIAPRFGFAYDVLGNGRSVLRGGIGQFYGYMPDILLSNPLTQISGNFNQISIICATAGAVKCPTYPNLLTPEQFAQLARVGTDIVTVGPQYQAQQAVRSSLQYEQQIGAYYSAGVGGIYQKTKNVQGTRNVNAVLQPYTFGNLPVYTISSPNRRYTDMQVVRELFSGEEASYRSLTLETHRLAVNNAKFTWDLSYTWSKAIDQDTNERSTSTSFLYDPFNTKLSEGPSDNDVRHRIGGDVTYRLPWGLRAAALGYWRSGVPYSRGIAFSGAMNLNGLTQTTGNIPVFVNANGEIIDLTRASGMTRPQLAAFLNSQDAHIIGRNTERQPSVWNLDARLAKSFNPIHGIELELIGEVFNLLNVRNKLVTSANTNMFNAVYSATASGSLPADRYTFTRVTNFGLEGGYASVDPRQFQVAAKIIF